MACREPETETTPSVIRRNRSRFRGWPSPDQETRRKPQRGENLEGPRLDDRRTIPQQRLGPLIDQDVRHAAASEFNCKHKTRGTGADNEDGIHGLPPFSRLRLWLRFLQLSAG
jgi:hypothetical protein